MHARVHNIIANNILLVSLASHCNDLYSYLGLYMYYNIINMVQRYNDATVQRCNSALHACA